MRKLHQIWQKIFIQDLVDNVDESQSKNNKVDSLQYKGIHLQNWSNDGQVCLLIHKKEEDKFKVLGQFDFFLKVNKFSYKYPLQLTFQVFRPLATRENPWVNLGPIFGYLLLTTHVK